MLYPLVNEIAETELYIEIIQDVFVYTNSLGHAFKVKAIF